MINCTFEDGGKADPGLRHATVSAIAYNTKGEILLVKRSKKFSRPNTWTVPGGFLDRNKTTEEAVLKELKEEAGMEGQIEQLFHVNDSPLRTKEDRQNVDFVYTVKVLEGEFKVNDETTSIGWFDKNTLPPEEEFAFDHRAAILKFFEYLNHPFILPLVGKL